MYSIKSHNPILHSSNPTPFQSYTLPILHSSNPTVGAVRNETLVFRELLSLRCIKIKNLCAHHQEEVLRIPKHPQLTNFA